MARKKPPLEAHAGYTMTRMTYFEDGTGFALGENLSAPGVPYTTWQFSDRSGERDYFDGHPHADAISAIGDFNRRVFTYRELYHVHEVEKVVPDFYRYYRVTGPGSCDSFPRPKNNLPVAFINYYGSRGVEGGSFGAWGELWYMKPLSQRMIAQFGLRPSPRNPDLNRGKAKPIAQQMAEAGRVAAYLRVARKEQITAPARGGDR